MVGRSSRCSQRMPVDQHLSPSSAPKPGRPESTRFTVEVVCHPSGGQGYRRPLSSRFTIHSLPACSPRPLRASSCNLDAGDDADDAGGGEQAGPDVPHRIEQHQHERHRKDADDDVHHLADYLDLRVDLSRAQVVGSGYVVPRGYGALCKLPLPETARRPLRR